MAFLDEAGLAYLWNQIIARLPTNDFTNEQKLKLDGIESGAEVNVQSDWNEEDPTSDAYIKNKLVTSEFTTDEIQDAWNAIFI